jgi:glycosyltransferase involved in cell wall biosynthesis
MTSEPVRPKLDLVMPVHNEGAAIERTLREWHAELSPAVDLRFVIAEDGSRDNTKEVLRRLEKELPMHLDTAEHRRGYAGGMMAALSASTTPYVLTSDSDGQTDPKDFWRLWAMREDYDLIVGWRVKRIDPLSRLLMSKCFKFYHKVLFGTRLHDPSCNVMLLKRWVVESLVPKLGGLVEGFQWELVARAVKGGLEIGEVGLNHRARASGRSVVYAPARVPGIAWRNGIGLLKVWLEH